MGYVSGRVKFCYFTIDSTTFSLIGNWVFANILESFFNLGRIFIAIILHIWFPTLDCTFLIFLFWFFCWKIVWNCFRFWKILKNEFKRVEDPLDIAFSPEAHKISSMVVSGNFCLDKECVFENFLKGKLVLWCLIFRGI